MTALESSYLEDIKQVALKNRVWYVGVVLFVGIIIVSFILFYEPKVKMDTTLIKAKEKEIEALKSQTKAFENHIVVLNSALSDFAKRDSVLISIGLTTKESVLKIKSGTNEKIKVFNAYSSDDWTVYYSNLPEPQRQ